MLLCVDIKCNEQGMNCNDKDPHNEYVALS